MKPILVTYATRAGATREVAEYISTVLRERGAVVECRPVKDAGDLGAYNAVIIGSAIRNGQVLTETIALAKRFKDALRRIPVAYFVTCMTLREDTPATRQKVEPYLNALCAVVPPVAKGYFAGVFDPQRLEQPWRFFMSHSKSDALPEGDFRDWAQIRRWAEALPV